MASAEKLAKTRFYPSRAGGDIISDLLTYLREHPEDTETHQLFDSCRYKHDLLKDYMGRMPADNRELRQSNISSDSELQAVIMDCARCVEDLIRRLRKVKEIGNIKSKM